MPLGSRPSPDWEVEHLGPLVFKLPGVKTDTLHPRLKERLAFIAAFLLARIEKPVWIAITSGERSAGTHAKKPDGRVYSVDFDVEGLESDPEVRQALSEAMGLVQSFFPYGIGGDGKWHWSYVWELDDLHKNHVHLQMNFR